MGIHLVTGVSGFIGAHLARRLLDEGVEVRGLDRDRPPRELLDRSGFEFRSIDLTAGVPRDLLEGVRTLYHLAASTGVSPSWGAGFGRYLSDNVVATQNLMSTLVDYDVQRVIFAGSGSVYGEGPRKPMTEDVVPRPHSPYAVTKKAAEDVCLAYHANFGLPVTSLRLFYVVGPRQRPDVVVHRMISAALRGEELEIWGDPNEIGRDFISVHDVIDAFVAAGQTREPAIGQVINIGSGKLTSLSTVADIVTELCDSKLSQTLTEARPGFVTGAPADISRATASMDWRPRRELAESLMNQIEWQRSGRW